MIKHVIIVAGGKGLRMGNELPKQFIKVEGKPILMYTIESFFRYDNNINIILVLPKDYQDYWNELCQTHKFQITHTIVDGGETRFHSVKNGLKEVSGGLVAVHDGARPFATVDLISRIFNEAIKYKAVIPVIDATDSLREILDATNHSRIIDRSKIRLVQTPQVFHSEILKRAYQTDYTDTFTDDASVVEAEGTDIVITQGEVTNIKITTPFDLEIAKVIKSTLNDLCHTR